MKSEVRELSGKVDSLAKRFDGQLGEVISKMGEMPTRADVAATVAEAGKDRMTPFISWGLAVGLAPCLHRRNLRPLTPASVSG